MKSSSTKIETFFLYILSTILLSSQLALAVDAPKIRPYFNRPSANGVADHTLRLELERLIDQTKDEDEKIRASFYSLSLRSTVDALIRAHRRNVDVKVVLDNNWNDTENSREAAQILIDGIGSDRVTKCLNDGCINYSGNNHNKFFTFSKTQDATGKSIYNVSVLTSSNMNSSQLEVYQDMLVIENDLDIYNHFFGYWRDLSKQVEIVDYQTKFGTTSSGYQKIKAYSSGNTTTDIMLEALKGASCTRGSSRIDMSQSLFKNDRGDKFINELSRLKNLGCEVHILLPLDSEDQASFNLARGFHLDLTLINADLDIFSHSKLLLINANFAGNENKKMVFMGSLNMVESSRKENDDSFVQVTDDTVYQSYLNHIEFIRERVLASAKTPMYLDYPNVSYKLGPNSVLIKPTISSGLTVTNCSVTPALPAGLTISSSTCAISGTPSANAVKKDYVVTATSKYRSHLKGEATVSIEVASIPAPLLPPMLNPGPFVLSRPVYSNVIINFPNSGGTISNCTIVPSLPEGLVINSKTCQITGMSVNITAMTTYTVTATNAAGSSRSIMHFQIAWR